MEFSQYDFHLIASALASRVNKNLELLSAMKKEGHHDAFMLDLTMENLYLLIKIEDGNPDPGYNGPNGGLQRYLLNPKEVYANLEKCRADLHAAITKSLGL